ncbi:hypothetical protein V5R04_13635 [Jonesiaceae bacterium BS-20]|uniref:NnrS family protein n=1 Tax=Jonesiaceae bacterium BS-20 TaxID=3120821 RepID=A0AAU7DX03_9MICO
MTTDAAPTPSAAKPTGRNSHPIPLRALLIIPGGISLLVGLNAALQLLGLPAPIALDRLPDVHGLLMTLGFVGTLITLERSVAYGKAIGYLPPAFIGAGGLLLISPAPIKVAHILLLAGTLGLCLLYLPLWRRNRDEAVLIQAVGAVMAAVAPALLIAGFGVNTLLPWLAGLVILTIGGERLELARMVMGKNASAVLVTMSGAFLSAAIVSLMWPLVGYPLLGAVLLIMTVWLAFHDVAKRTINAKGAVRFMAACMLAGYFWLALAGAVWVTGPAFDGERYDAVIHGIFVGFTMSMIMAHATVILPAVIRRPLPYRLSMWWAAGVVHVGLIIRIWIGDGLMVAIAHQIGGLLNVIGLLAFFIIAAWSAISGPPARSARSPQLARSNPAEPSGASSHGEIK